MSLLRIIVLLTGVKYVIATTAVTVSSGERMAMAGGQCHCCSPDPLSGEHRVKYIFY